MGPRLVRFRELLRHLTQLSVDLASRIGTKRDRSVDRRIVDVNGDDLAPLEVDMDLTGAPDSGPPAVGVQ